VQHIVANMRVHGAPPRAISSNYLRVVAIIRALMSAVQAWASGRGPSAHVVAQEGGSGGGVCRGHIPPRTPAKKDLTAAAQRARRMSTPSGGGIGGTGYFLPCGVAVRRNALCVRNFSDGNLADKPYRSLAVAGALQYLTRMRLSNKSNKVDHDQLLKLNPN
jgi:hypothetical protein